MFMYKIRIRKNDLVSYYQDLMINIILIDDKFSLKFSLDIKFSMPKLESPENNISHLI